MLALEVEVVDEDDDVELEDDDDVELDPEVELEPDVEFDVEVEPGVVLRLLAVVEGEPPHPTRVNTEAIRMTKYVFTRDLQL